MNETKDTIETKDTKIRYRVGKRNFFTKFAWLLLGISLVFTVMANWGFWEQSDKYAVYYQLLLPVVSCVAYMIIINHMGEKSFSLTIIPVMCGAAFLTVSVIDSGKMLQSLICITLCFVVTLTYATTVLGLIRTKWLLLPLIGVPLIYRTAVEDYDLFFAGRAVHIADLLPEISIICMMAAMLFIVFAMKKRDFSKNEKSIENVLVELEENPYEDEPVEDAAELDNRSEAQRSYDDTVIIAPAGEKYE